jgi:threonyl-tRNA synthetase
MIHRAPFGSMERFIGVLTEHFAGAFPLWLAPVQVAVLSISEKYLDYAKQVVESLKAAGLRVEPLFGPEKVGSKIRDASMAKIPYLLIVGEQEANAGKVSVRTPRNAEKPDQGQMPLAEFVQRAQQEISTKGVSHATVTTEPAAAR